MLKAAQALEWLKFLDLAEKEALTKRGKALLRVLVDAKSWAHDLATARILQQETSEVSQLLDREGLWAPLTDLGDPEEAIERLGRGSVLEIAELAAIRRWLYALDSWGQVPRDEIRGELFKKALSSLPDAYQPLRVLDRVLTPEGELSEKASPRLGQLHSEIRALKREISIVLDQLLKTFSQKGILQENFTDVRDGRYVLPVKIASQNEVDGIIYEASASRQTVFVEPKEVAQLNNRLRQRQNELLQEIYAVLAATSSQLKPFAADIHTAVLILSHWDCVQARARLGRHYGGKPILVTNERLFEMRHTAHPLLFWSLPHEQIIRNGVEFGGAAAQPGGNPHDGQNPVATAVRTLLLTGPNTGGKTVLLKTLGLAAFCARTGFLFPGSDSPTVPFFDQVFADLGDHQSIEQHLSSFSGHIVRFKEILENVDERSLVLIDELNSATDPEEGAALGRAFLETVMAHGAIIVTTTHDPHLKATAVSDHRILNASMQFDEQARTPTYRMILGVPGRSRALETAERLGISSDVLTLARKYLSREHIEFEAMLAKLEQDAREADRARREAEHLRAEAERMHKEWTERTETAVGEMLDRTRQRLRRILEAAQDEVRASVRKLDEAKNRHEIDKTRAQLNESLTLASERMESALTEEAPEIADALAYKAKARAQEPAKAPKLETGTAVRIPKWKSTGTILEITGNRAKVSMGTIQMSLALSDIEPLSALEISALPKSRPKPSSGGSGATSFVPESRLDLRGVRFEEAMSELQRYLDLVFRSGALMEVTIVHGMGTGALREGTRKILSSLPYIKNYRDGGVGLGGAGATLVEIDRD